MNENRKTRAERNSEFSIASKRVERAVQAGDWKAASQAYFELAHILYFEGRGNHQSALRESHRFDLLSMKEVGIRSVEISTAGTGSKGACPQCRKLEGRKFSIARALKEMPLPKSNCGGGPHDGWCRCSYQAVIPTSRPRKKPESDPGDGVTGCIVLAAVLIVVTLWLVIL